MTALTPTSPANWNTDISAAPRGKIVTSEFVAKGVTRTRALFEPDAVLVATKCGKVTKSEWIPDEGRWLMLAKGEEPVAWQPWPTHPHSLSNPPTADKPAGAPPTTPSQPAGSLSAVLP